MFTDATSYRHNKTGNIYEYLSEVSPSESKPSKFTSCITASCSETETKVKIYFEEDNWYYVPEENPTLEENTVVKVLYDRDGALWLRSKDMFHELVDFKGVLRPRFERIEDEDV